MNHIKNVQECDFERRDMIQSELEKWKSHDNVPEMNNIISCNKSHMDSTVHCVNQNEFEYGL